MLPGVVTSRWDIGLVVARYAVARCDQMLPGVVTSSRWGIIVIRLLLLFCQTEAVDAGPLLDEAAAPAVHPPAHSGVLDVVSDQEEQDEGEQGSCQELWRRT